jgi:beta-glucanase (GH16 family)
MEYTRSQRWMARWKTRGAARAFVRLRTSVYGAVSLLAVSCGSSSTNKLSASDAGPGDGSTSEDVGSGTPVDNPAEENAPSVDSSAPLEEANAPEVEAGVADATEDTAGWTLTWSDEFNLPDGSAADPSNWNYDTGGSGEGNNELEYYTKGTANAVIQGGNLVITARSDDAAQYQCWYGTCQYTSARLNSAGNFSQQYGRIEASIQIPSGQGDWPAFWMLGNNIGNVGWPACGEIDILESVNVATTAYGSLHGTNFNATAGYTPADKVTLDNAFHTYAVEWDQQSINFLVDDQVYETQTASAATNGGGQWPFNQPFFIILNFAVGGNWPGSPDGTATFPQTMKVDWVRVYTKD